MAAYAGGRFRVSVCRSLDILRPAAGYRVSGAGLFVEELAR